MIQLEKMFGSKKPIIGALHFMPLLGYLEFGSFDEILEKAIQDLKVLEDGGINGIILENNYDLPHKINVGSETVSSMTYLASKIFKETKIPLGVSVLWNDFRASLSIAKTIGAKFVRVPVFVDDVETDFGIIYGKPKNVIDYRRSINADEIAIFADIQVKHAKMLKNKPIETSAVKAESAGADAIIVTGKWTGDAPIISDLIAAKSNVKIPVIIGSGLDINNAVELLSHCDGAIVSTSIKEETPFNSKERNIKPYTARISKKRVSELINKLLKSD